MDFVYLVLILCCLQFVSPYCTNMNNRKEGSPDPKVFLDFSPNDDSFIKGSTFTLTCKGVSAELDNRNKYPKMLFVYAGPYDRIKKCPKRGIIPLNERTAETICSVNHTTAVVNKIRFSCMVYDHISTCTIINADINIKEPKSPNITEQPPRHINVSEGLDLNITCASYELPRPVITWYKDGGHVMDYNVKWYRGKSTLMIGTVVPSTEGRYWCEAENSLGKATSNGTIVTVFSPPKLSIDPVNQTVALGTEVILTCSVTGHPLPIIGWMKDGEDLGTGAFQARVMSESDVQSNQFNNVSVTTSIRGSALPSSASVAIGNHTVTSHVMQGSVAHSVTRSTVTMATSTTRATNGIQSPSFTRVGNITMTSHVTQLTSTTGLTNDMQSPGSSIALHVVSLSRIPLSRNTTASRDVLNSSIPSALNTTVTVRASPPSGNATLNRITPSAITPLLPDTTSQYTLSSTKTTSPVITNATTTMALLPKTTSRAIIANTTSTSSIPLSSITASSSTVTITPNTTILNITSINSKTTPSTTTSSPTTTSTIIATTQPPTKRPFSGVIKQEGRNSTLVIKSSSREDQGRYLCYASNALGNVNSSESLLYVFVKETKPRFEVVPRNVTAFLGMNVALNCSATGNPIPNITWYENDSLVTNGNRVSIATVNDMSVLKITSVTRDDEGIYVCLAKNVVGAVSSEAYLKTKEGAIPGKQARSNGVVVWSVTGSILGLLVVIVIIVFIYVIRRRKRETQKQLTNQRISLGKLETAHKESQNEDLLDDLMYLSLMGIERDWELPRDRLQVTNEKLGSGCFGNVYLGVYTRKDVKEMMVAVKMLKDTATTDDRKDILAELEILKRVGRHPNIVSLVGACTLDDPINIVIELVEGGNLHELLHKSRTPLYYDEKRSYKNVRSSLNDRDLVTIALDVAKGMQHLHKKQCIHRDLAARNVLIAKDLVAKISDFGLAREVPSDGLYVTTTGGKVPWKWMSPEALRGLFTSKSDIWSFGILLWEIVTLGDLPYPGISQVITLYNLLVDGHRLEKPLQCDELLYALMSICWSPESDSRPEFEEIRSTLQEILNQNERIYINLIATDADENLEHSF